MNRTSWISGDAKIDEYKFSMDGVILPLGYPGYSHCPPGRTHFESHGMRFKRDEPLKNIAMEYHEFLRSLKTSDEFPHVWVRRIELFEMHYDELDIRMSAGPINEIGYRDYPHMEIYSEIKKVFEEYHERKGGEPICAGGTYGGMD